MTVFEALNSLPKRKRADAIWLLSALLKVSKSELLLEARKLLSPLEEKTWKAWRKRWARGEPLQYVAGSAPFFGREFLVSRRVLIPRPETECLVELSLGLLRNSKCGNVLDIGTGSGAIACTLKLERPELSVLGTDLSAAAISVAEANAEALGANVGFARHDLFSPELQTRSWGLVVSNPPYLEFGRDHVAENVKRWEPRAALEPAAAAGKGLKITRAAWCAEKILQACERSRPEHTALELSPRVALFLERRWKKRESVNRIWREADLAGRKRFLLISWKHT